MKSRIIIAALAVLSAWSCSSDRNSEPPTAWMKEARLGAFMQFLPDESNFDLVDQFDVDYLADQLESIGAGYFVFTLGQNSGCYNAPNPVYDEISGYKAWVVAATLKGTAVTLDMGPNYDPEAAPVGSISREQADQFRQLSAAIR